MNKQKTHIAIIAGGKGQRFWPISRLETPKQLQALCGKVSLLQQTIERVWGWVPEENIWIIANDRIKEKVEALLSDRVAIRILSEPKGRDTAAAIAFAASHIHKVEPDAVMVVLPSDHFIGDRIHFLKTLERAVDQGDSGKIVTLGLKPSFAATQYGYLMRGEEIENGMHYLKQFCEKPTAVVAQRFLETGDYYWNSGMFVWKTSVILELCKEFLPDLSNRLKKYREQIGTEQEAAALREFYNGKFKNQSVDFGIMEPATIRDPHLAVIISADFPWNDVGNWSALECLIKPDFSGNTVVGRFLGINCRNNIVWGDGSKVIAGLGLENVIIVDTEDALLVANRNDLDEIKKLLKRIHEEGWEEYL